MKTRMSMTVATLCGLAAGPASASVFGSLANFDVVNDTGKPAYGFEIEFDDASFDHTKIVSVFGLNRDFGLPGGPGAVERFGLPTITDLPGVGVRITYGGAIGSVFTPSGPYNTPGESCWPLGGGWSTAASCDHYGVTTLGTPASTKYSWLVEASPGVLSAQPTGVPAVQFAYTPPVPAAGGQPAAPAVVNANIRAVAPNAEHPENPALWGEAFWVKTFATKVPNAIDLGNLLRGDPEQEQVEVETEWSTFQKPPAGHVGDGPNEVKVKDLALGDADKAVIRRYEFYKYVGPFNVDGSGELDCNTACENDPLGLDAASGHTSFVGDFVGAQMAGFNVEQVGAPVPEPGRWAMLVAGLGVLGLSVARRKSC